MGGTYIKKLKKTTDLLEKWTGHNKNKTKLHAMAHSTMIKHLDQIFKTSYLDFCCF